MYIYTIYVFVYEYPYSTPRLTQEKLSVISQTTRQSEQHV